MTKIIRTLDRRGSVKTLQTSSCLTMSHGLLPSHSWTRATGSFASRRVNWVGILVSRGRAKGKVGTSPGWSTSVVARAAYQRSAVSWDALAKVGKPVCREPGTESKRGLILEPIGAAIFAEAMMEALKQKMSIDLEANGFCKRTFDGVRGRWVGKESGRCWIFIATSRRE